MNQVEFDVAEWLGGASDLSDLTFGSLLIRVGSPGIALTEVHDSMAQTTRPTIRVATFQVAEWFLAHWWRLRWEPRPETPTYEWRCAHSMAALGGGFAWPGLEIASDGEFVQFALAGERAADVAAIRYLNDVTVEVPAQDFELAVERFVGMVESRISSVFPKERELFNLHAELRSEQQDPTTALRCRWAARAGFDSGDAPDGWFAEVEGAVGEAGDTAIEDLLAASGDGSAAGAAMLALKQAHATIDLGWVPQAPAEPPGTKPWQRGAHAAQLARSKFGIGEGPVTKATLSEVLGRQLPIPVDVTAPRPVLGGYRARDGAGVTRVLVNTARLATQRFYLARVIGMACLLPRSDQVLPVTTMRTAAQKFGRSFAQEFLCPWAELDEYTNEHGVGEDAISTAAERYGVSEMLITTTLVNRGKLDRARLAAFQS